MTAISPAQIASFEIFTIDPKLREQTFPGSARNSIDSTSSGSTISSHKKIRFKLPWSKY
jgi:hypothetical protein